MTYHMNEMIDVANTGITSAQADVSGLAFFAPILAFLVVFVVMYALLLKTKILGEHNLGLAFVAFIIATLFVIVDGVRELVLTATPWFAVLLIALFFVLVLMGFMGKTEDIVGKGLGWLFVIVLIAVFLISGITAFSDSLGSYLPGPYYGLDADPQILYFTDWLYSPKIVGTFWLILAAVVVSWVLVKYSGKKD